MDQQRPFGVDHHPAAEKSPHPPRMRFHVHHRVGHRRREPAGPLRAQRSASGDQAHRRYSLASTAMAVSVVRSGRINASWLKEAISSPSSV